MQLIEQWREDVQLAKLSVESWRCAIANGSSEDHNQNRASPHNVLLPLLHTFPENDRSGFHFILLLSSSSSSCCCCCCFLHLVVHSCCCWLTSFQLCFFFFETFLLLSSFLFFLVSLCIYVDINTTTTTTKGFPLSRVPPVSFCTKNTAEALSAAAAAEWKCSARLDPTLTSGDLQNPSAELNGMYLPPPPNEHIKIRTTDCI